LPRFGTGKAFTPPAPFEVSGFSKRYLRFFEVKNQENPDCFCISFLLSFSVSGK
jgi:hypothetical protein